jgi:hypothetical protein
VPVARRPFEKLHRSEGFPTGSSTSKAHSAAHETATRYAARVAEPAWGAAGCEVRVGCRMVTLKIPLGSRTSLGGYTHDPTHMIHVYDPIRRLMSVYYVIRGHRVAVSDIRARV